MALPRLTYARVKGTRTVGETTLLDIAVQTDEGEIHPGEIVAGGYVTAGSLIVGMLVGRDFEPMQQGEGQRSGGSGFVRARITDSSSIGYGKYEYEWVEVEPADGAGSYSDVENGKSSTEDGPLRNSIEVPNESDSVLGSGINTENLPANFNPVPIGNGAVVWISGPFGTESDPWWDMCVSTHVDGECVPSAAQGGST